jgi:SAM-dependent methyltransferase
MDVVREYPSEIQDRLVAVHGSHDLYVERTAHDVGLVAGATSQGCVVDVGAGIGLFAIGCRFLRMRAIALDDFFEFRESDSGKAVVALLESFGVQVVSRDVIDSGIDFADESVDAVGMFHTIEHLHNSPRKLFQQISRALRPRGLFVLSGPNGVNLRKRFAVPLGKSNGSPMSDWYEEPVFRGHVREPVVADLRYIAEDMELGDVRIVGRNFLGIGKFGQAARLADPLLRLRPSLCSDIYLIGKKRA